MRARHLIVTGGTGYIGARLIETALAQGRKVTLLSRRPAPHGTQHVSWRLGEPFPVKALAPSFPATDQALIHLAHDWQGNEALNVDGTDRLFATARAAGIGTNVFISSQSARREALNSYGRMKWAAEQRILDDSSLRVGLVFGGPHSAMYGLLCRLTRLPVLPMVDPHRTVQPIHLDDVVKGILAAADGRASGVLALAGPEPLAFGSVLKAVALGFGGRRLTIIPIPLRLALFACDLTARLPFLPTVDRERVLGLAGTQPIESRLDLARLGIHARPLAESLAREQAGRRAILAEGRAFLRHAGIAPSSALLRRYVRALPQGAIARPRLFLRWREPYGQSSVLAARVRVAARLAEASKQGESTLAQGTREVRLARLLISALAEAAYAPTRLFATLISR